MNQFKQVWSILNKFEQFWTGSNNVEQALEMLCKFKGRVPFAPGYLPYIGRLPQEQFAHGMFAAWDIWPMICLPHGMFKNC